jgi:hypothetical protein
MTTTNLPGVDWRRDHTLSAGYGDNIDSDRSNRGRLCLAKQPPSAGRSQDVGLKCRTDFDFSLPIGQIEEEIAVIEAGLERLNRSHSA